MSSFFRSFSKKEGQQKHAAEPAVPDYMLDPDAVLKDRHVQWRHVRAPDYSKTRKMYNETKSRNHAPGSLESMVENLVKNWEIEASYKPVLSEWRTVDHSKYTFAVNGGPPQDAKHMLQVGTYNAIISPNTYYSPDNSTFDSSHKTFKRMMPTFAWEVLEVYSPPPVVAFRWRHWGVMKSDYVGYNDQGCLIRIKAHGEKLDIQGVTVAKVNEKFQVTSLETWFDPLEMFAQMRPDDTTMKVEFNDEEMHGDGEKIIGGDTKADAALEALLSKIDNAPLVTTKTATMMDPHSGGKEKSEARSLNFEVPANHPAVHGNLGTSACPFLSSQAKNNQSPLATPTQA